MAPRPKQPTAASKASILPREAGEGARDGARSFGDGIVMSSVSGSDPVAAAPSTPSGSPSPVKNGGG